MYDYFKTAFNDNQWLSGFLAAVCIIVLVIFLLVISKQYNTEGRLATAYCRAKQLLRRHLWLVAVAAGLFLYPAQVDYTVRVAAGNAAEAASASPGRTLESITAAAAQAAADTRAQVVAPSYLFSKMSIAVGVFCLIMLLGWGALQLVIPVIPNWATGDYADPDRAAAVGLDAPVVGFKRSFLRQSDLARVGLLLGFLTLLVLAAGLSVWAAFSVQ